MNQLERLKQAAKKALAMREAQKTYFKVRTREALVASKELEREVDKLLPTALKGDDMLETIESDAIVANLPPAAGREGAERVVTDVLHMLVCAIAVGGGTRKAKVASDGQDWRVKEWLAP